jgi:hypothetical protein
MLSIFNEVNLGPRSGKQKSIKSMNEQKSSNLMILVKSLPFKPGMLIAIQTRSTLFSPMVFRAASALHAVKQL